MEIKEIRLKGSGELNQLKMELKKKLDDLNFRAHEKQLKDVREIRETKKNLAKVLMVLKEKTLNK